MSLPPLGFADWDDVKDWDAWSVPCQNNSDPCFVVGELVPTMSNCVRVSGTVTVPMALDPLSFASKRAAYTWGYKSCKMIGDDAVQTRIYSPFESHPYSDTVPDCPGVKTISYGGILTLDSTLIFSVELITPWVGRDANASRVVFSGFNLKMAPLDPPMASTVISSTSSALSTAPISSANSSSITSTSSTASTLSTLLPIDVTLTPQASSTVLPTSTVPIPSTGNGGDTQSSRTTVIAGTVAGGFVALVLSLVILVWWWLRRRTRARMELKNKVATSPEGDSFTSLMAQPSPRYMPYGGVFQSSRKQRDDTPSEPLEGEETLEEPVVTPQTPRPPQEPSIHQGNNVPLPAYENYMDAPLVTFRPSGTRRPQGIETPAQDVETMNAEDVLHKWAEGRRDLVPVHLERRLRSGGYDPAVHPDEIPEEIWMERFGVTRYELAGLRDAYGR